MGTRAHWFKSKWRYREVPEDGDTFTRWMQADTLGDIKEDVRNDPSLEKVEVQRRTGHAGRKAADYTYEHHSVITRSEVS